MKLLIHWGRAVGVVIMTLALAACRGGMANLFDLN